MNKLLTAAELADLLKVKPATVHTWRRRGWIPCLRVSQKPVLFDSDKVLEAMAARTAQRNG